MANATANAAPTNNATETQWKPGPGQARAKVAGTELPVTIIGPGKVKGTWQCFIASYVAEKNGPMREIAESALSAPTKSQVKMVEGSSGVGTAELKEMRNKLLADFPNRLDKFDFLVEKNRSADGLDKLRAAVSDKGFKAVQWIEKDEDSGTTAYYFGNKLPAASLTKINKIIEEAGLSVQEVKRQKRPRTTETATENTTTTQTPAAA